MFLLLCNLYSQHIIKGYRNDVLFNLLLFGYFCLPQPLCFVYLLICAPLSTYFARISLSARLCSYLSLCFFSYISSYISFALFIFALPVLFLSSCLSFSLNIFVQFDKFHNLIFCSVLNSKLIKHFTPLHNIIL